ncbi:hypothetical protein SEMRO_1299_G260700.1 [Seminavis robusta]|uniref:Uncharacterized protein n=1 Tax=Seminavis robusta TaxID=568900 RepID=A0A9N8EIS5_9STRA|nr:hypothetical protein SEMRO_1299_G260700.1 [Seminavis robusta]|eukprot:Sro1299_g260700.1 n/a (240) ;mRNA; f:28857-29648
MSDQYPKGAIIIIVDNEKPEGNGPFWVYPVPDMESVEEGQETKGFLIMCSVDQRCDERDGTVQWISAKMVGRKQIHFRVPSLPFFMMPLSAIHQDAVYKALDDQLPESIMKSINHSVAFLTPSTTGGSVDPMESAVAEARKWTTYVLDFSRVSYVGELKASLVSREAGTDEVLSFDYILLPCKWEADGMAEEASELEEFLGFRVGVELPQAQASRKVGRPQQAQKSKMQLWERKPHWQR